MIILPVDKRPLPGDELVPLDAPPSYDALEGVHPPSLQQSEKAGPSSSSIAAWSLSSQDKAPRRPAPWFSFGAHGRTARSVRVTVLGILRDVVKHAARPESLGLLASCSDACRTYDLSFSAILQEPSVEGHTPIYWAVINRPPEPPREDTPDLVTALLTMAAPLADATLSELRLACLQTSDQALFQCLRLSPAFAPLSGTEEIILGGSVPPDEVVVEEMPGDEGAFAVCVRFPMFQKRMRISKEVALEFIARGRLWSLKFFVVAEHDMRTGFKYYAPGTWVVTLALLEHSPPTCIDSRLTIADPRHAPPASPPSPAGEARHKPKPTICLRLKTTTPLTPPVARCPQSSLIIASLGDSLMANSLQYTGSSYIGEDGALQAKLEARLARPDAECVIC